MIDILLYVVLIAGVLNTLVLGGNGVLYGVALLSPLFQVMPAPLGGVSTPTNLVLGAMAGHIFFRRRASGARSEPLPLRGPILIFVLVLLIGLGIRAVGHLNEESYETTFLEAAKNTWYWITPFVMYYFVFRLVDLQSVVGRIVALCQFSIATECLITLYERVAGYARATAHLREPNLAGAYFAGASAFFLAWFMMETGKRRWIFFGCWMAAVVAVFNSLSRGGLVAASAGCLMVILFFFLTVRKRTGTKVLLVVLLVIGLLNASWLIPDFVKERVLFTFGGENRESKPAGELDQSSRERLLYWSIAWDYFLQNPFGYGAFSFPSISVHYHWRGMQTHNIYLEVLVEDGIQGFIGLMILIIAVWLALLKSFRGAATDGQRVLALSLIGWWTAHMVAHLFVSCFFLLAVNGHFWLLLACLFATRKKSFVSDSSTLFGSEPATAPPAPLLAPCAPGPCASSSPRLVLHES